MPRSHDETPETGWEVSGRQRNEADYPMGWTAVEPEGRHTALSMARATARVKRCDSIISATCRVLHLEVAFCPEFLAAALFLRTPRERAFVNGMAAYAD